jgi:hypothetical protein
VQAVDSVADKAARLEKKVQPDNEIERRTLNKKYGQQNEDYTEKWS